MVSRWFPLYSTAQALIEITDHTKHLLDEIHCVISIFLDFEKVFDRVSRAILLYKLDCYGIGRLANDFFRSYLTNSLQYTDTVINGVNPDLWTVSCGAPQESLPGPNFLLYKMISTDLSGAIILDYRDDTAIITNNHDINYAQE